MNYWHPPLNSLVETFGWVLTHSLWQILAIAIVLGGLLMGMRRSAASLRYWVCCAAMVSMLAAPIATLAWLTAEAGPVQVAIEWAEPIAWLLEPRDGNPGPSHAMVQVANSPAIQPLPKQTNWQQLTLRYAVLVYLIGTTILTSRLMSGYWRLRRLQQNVTPADATLRERLAALMKHWGITRHVELLVSAAVEVPTVLGFLKPVILLPLTATSGLSEDQVSVLIAHELAHVRRHDFLINAMQAVIETLLFYHPAVWWISRRIRQEREHCCDDMVVSFGTSRVVYAKALTEMESLRPSVGLAMAVNSTSLLPRIQRILQANASGGQAHRLNISIAAIVPMIVIAVLLAVVACKNTSTTPAEPAQAATQPATDADDQYTISIETRVMLVSDNFFDQLGIGQTSFDPSPLSPKALDIPFTLSSSVNSATILDNWTLNLLIHATQADERSLVFDLKRQETYEGQAVRISSKGPDVVLPEGTPSAFGFSFTVEPAISKDRRYVVLRTRDGSISRGNVAEPAEGIKAHITTNAMLSIPDGGTMLLHGGPVEGNRFALFLVRPRIQLPKNQATSQPASTENLRVYDVRALLVQPAVGIQPPFGGDPEAGAEEKPVGRDVLVQRLVEQIETTVDPDSWTNRGGKIGKINELNGQLVITQTPKNHAAIRSLIHQLTEKHCRQIAVEARIWLVDDETFKKLNLPQAKEGEKRVDIVDDEQLAKLHKVIIDTRTAVTIDAPRLTLFDGQRGFIPMTSPMNYVSDYKSKVDEKGVVQSHLEVETLSCGLIVFIEGRVMPDRKSAAMKIKSSLRELMNMVTLIPEGKRVGELEPNTMFIQRPVLREVEMSADRNVPDGHTLVLSGMTLANYGLPRDPNVKRTDPIEPLDMNARGHLVVLVRPRVILHTEIEVDEGAP